jgi:hypothetical protein
MVGIDDRCKDYNTLRADDTDWHRLTEKSPWQGTPTMKQTKARTSRGDYAFVVKEYGDGTPWIMLELRQEPGLSIILSGFLGFDLAPGTTLERAKEIAALLNREIPSVSYTHMVTEATN